MTQDILEEIERQMKKDEQKEQEKTGEYVVDGERKEEKQKIRRRHRTSPTDVYISCI